MENLLLARVRQDLVCSCAWLLSSIIHHRTTEEASATRRVRPGMEHEVSLHDMCSADDLAFLARTPYKFNGAEKCKVVGTLHNIHVIVYSYLPSWPCT
jgi:hypothetical protein